MSELQSLQDALKARIASSEAQHSGFSMAESMAVNACESTLQSVVDDIDIRLSKCTELRPTAAYLRPLVAFDVDDTLVDGDENPKADVVQLFFILQKLGCRMVIWTTGGGRLDQPCVEYAERIAQKLGLVDYTVLEKGSIQPDLCVDDADVYTRVTEGSLGRVNIRVPYVSCLTPGS